MKREIVTMNSEQEATAAAKTRKNTEEGSESEKESKKGSSHVGKALIIIGRIIRE